MDVSETLKEAWTAVEEAGLPERIHAVAFREAVRLISPAPMCAAPTLGTPQAGRPGGGGTSAPTGGGSKGDHAITVSEYEIYDRVVNHTGVDREKIEHVVHLDGDVLKLSIPGIKLGKNNAERARSVAQILTITRTFGLEEGETSLEIIRAECDRLRVNDQNNFSSHMRALNGYVISGTGTNRRVRAKSAGIQAFPALLDTLLGVSDG